MFVKCMYQCDQGETLGIGVPPIIDDTSFCFIHYSNCEFPDTNQMLLFVWYVLTKYGLLSNKYEYSSISTNVLLLDQMKLDEVKLGEHSGPEGGH